MRTTLPGGGWVDLLDADSITNRQRRNLLRNASKGGLDPYDQVDVYAASFITAWSLDLPLPTVENTPGTDEKPSPLDDLPLKTADAIYSAVTSIMDAITQSATEPDADPASPTSPSGA